MAGNPLNESQVKDALRELPGWSFGNDRITKTFRFDGFREAMGFIVRIGFEAEQRDHHPEIKNVYSTVDIALNTHDAGNKVTSKDIDLAKAIESVNWIPEKK